MSSCWLLLSLQATAAHVHNSSNSSAFANVTLCYATAGGVAVGSAVAGSAACLIFPPSCVAVVGYSLYSNGKMGYDIYQEGLEAGVDPCYEVRHAEDVTSNATEASETAMEALAAEVPAALSAGGTPRTDRVRNLAAVLTMSTLAAAVVVRAVSWRSTSRSSSRSALL